MVEANTGRPSGDPRRRARHRVLGGVRLDPGIELVVLAMSDHRANLEGGPPGARSSSRTLASPPAAYPDDVAELEGAGVDVARNLYGEAGQGLADDACDLLDSTGPAEG